MIRSVGRNVSRKDGAAKVGGTARYVDDLTRPGLLHARTIRSTIPCGDIARVRLEFDPAGFTLVDARDIPGRNLVSLIVEDQPCLAVDEVRHVAEPVLLIAHEDRERLLQADVEIDYNPRTPVLDPEQSPQVFKSIAINHGNLDEGFRQADLVIEGEYRTGHQEHLYIEPNGMLAVPEDGGVTVYGSLQCPYYVHKALCVLLNLPADKVRVVQAETGGGFGGKEEYPSMIAGHACLLALEVGPPGEADLRPHRGHAGDDQAPPVGRAASDRRHARRAAGGDGHRRADGRRRVLHAQPRRAVARLPPRHRALPLRPRARERPRRHDQHAAQRRVPRLRRAADAVRGRRPPGAHRRSAGHGPRAHPRDQRAAPGRHDGHGPGARARRGGPRRAAGRRGAQRFPSQAGGVARHRQGHRPVALLPWRRVHRQRRGEAEVEGLASSSRRPACACSRRAPRSARASAPCTPRSSRTRSAFRSTRSRSRRPTPASCPTAARPWPRGRRWSSAGC